MYFYLTPRLSFLYHSVFTDIIYKLEVKLYRKRDRANCEQILTVLSVDSNGQFTNEVFKFSSPLNNEPTSTRSVARIGVLCERDRRRLIRR